MNQRLSPRRQIYDKGLRALLWICAGITCALLVFLIGYIFYRGVGNLSWQLVSSQTSYIKGTIGILPNILNTLYIILVAMVIVLPLGVGAAIYLTEYATNHKVVAIIEFATETLTGIPSIIFGLVGMLFFLQKLGLAPGILAGGLTLVVMILPTIVRTTQESLKTVPQSYREGALGLGAGKWHMVRTVVLPNAIDGIVTGCILAVGRHADGGSVCVCERAGRDRGGIRHCDDFDDPDVPDQPDRKLCGQETEKITGVRYGDDYSSKESGPLVWPESRPAWRKY